MKTLQANLTANLLIHRAQFLKLISRHFREKGEIFEAFEFRMFLEENFNFEKFIGENLFEKSQTIFWLFLCAVCATDPCDLNRFFNMQICVRSEIHSKTDFSKEICGTSYLAFPQKSVIKIISDRWTVVHIFKIPDFFQTPSIMNFFHC